jgi:preprotein translocase subunit SecF
VIFFNYQTPNHIPVPKNYSKWVILKNLEHPEYFIHRFPLSLTHSLSRSLSQTLSLSLSLTHTQYLSHKHKLSHTLSHTHYLSFSLSLALSVSVCLCHSSSIFLGRNFLRRRDKYHQWRSQSINVRPAEANFFE